MSDFCKLNVAHLGYLSNQSRAVSCTLYNGTLKIQTYLVVKIEIVNRCFIHCLYVVQYRHVEYNCCSPTF